MRKSFVLVSAFILFHTAVICQSKYRAIPPLGMSLGIETAHPVGNIELNKAYGVGISMKTVTPFTSFCAFTLSGGAIKYFNKHSLENKITTKFFCFPMKAGINLFSRQGVYAEPQIGYTLLSSKYGTEGALCYAANIGGIVNHHLDISFNYEVKRKNRGNFSQLGARVAYIF